jgi:hypothetical protein
MSCARAALLVLLSAIAAGQTLATSAPGAAATPAEWKSYDVLLEFHALPRTYGCDELWYKVRDILQQLGARAYMTITPYECGSTRGAAGRSPSVEVKFQLPEPLQGANTRYAETTVRAQAVRLAPGTPGSLQAGDCELIRQLEEMLLAGLPLHITASTFECTASVKSFALTIEAPLVAHEGAAPSY